MKNSHYYPHSGGILGCHAYVDFQHTNYLLNVRICEKLRCAHKLQTISDAFSHIASRFLKVALAIKFALNWLAGPQCSGPGGLARHHPVPAPSVWQWHGSVSFQRKNPDEPREEGYGDCHHILPLDILGISCSLIRDECRPDSEYIFLDDTGKQNIYIESFQTNSCTRPLGRVHEFV